MSVQLQRTIIEEKFTSISKAKSWRKHEGLLSLVFGLVTGRSYDSLPEESVIDGNGEYKIDLLDIDDGSFEDFVEVTVIQSTTSDSMSANALKCMTAGLDYILSEPKARYEKLVNTEFRDLISEFRGIRNNRGASNVRVSCYFATMGDTSKLQGEFPQEIERIKSRFSSLGSAFSFEVLGPEEIVRRMDRRERREKDVDEKIAIVWDHDQGGNTLKHSIESVSGIVATVEARELARIVNKHSTIFDENLRRFLGLRGSVNKEIRATCTDDKRAPLFWFLNNGITIICDGFEPSYDPDHPYIKVKNLQIVNGCQTSATLAHCAEEAILKPNARVMVKVFKADASLKEEVVRTTNTQNAISSRDLKSSAEIHKDIQRVFKEKFQLKYERAVNEFSALPLPEQSSVISNEKVGQAYLGVVLKRPSDARRRKYLIWSAEHDRVFTPTALPESYLLAYRIVEACESWKRRVSKTLKRNEFKRRLLLNGTYHISRIASFLWKSGDNWSRQDELAKKISEIDANPLAVDRSFWDGFDLLQSVITAKDRRDFTSTLKSGRLDDVIDKTLYRRESDRKRS